MSLLIEKWVGKNVHVTLRLGGLAGAVTMQGNLIKIDESGVLLEQPKGEAYVPVTSILHVVLQHENA